MNSESDHTQPQLDITSYIPEVYRSNVSTNMMDVVFNRHLTKDDTQFVSGIIGTPNPLALINRQLTETTPHRQAYQLAPTMVVQVGTVLTALSFKAMEQQLELVGVDMNRFPLWGNTLQFNWIPPVNIDKLVNYHDYYWAPSVPNTPIQYLTIENLCNIATSRVIAYQKILTQYGSTFNVNSILIPINAFTITTKLDDLFVTDFVFFTNSANVNLQSKYWTVLSSSYNNITDLTTVIVVEPIAIHSATAPVASYVGQWWYNTTTTALFAWDGAMWISASANQVATISIAGLLDVYQAEANCFCGQLVGWDTTPWDDNQVGNVIWNAPLFNPLDPAYIEFATEAAWIAFHGAPTPYALWYDTTLDALKQFNLSSVWVIVVNNFSTIKNQTHGYSAWDLSTDPLCAPQKTTQWSQQNQWIHRSEVLSFAGVKNATMPILEYNARMELNEWAQDTHTWKYRKDPIFAFSAATTAPSRIELEPVKGFVASPPLTIINPGTSWIIYLFDERDTINRDVDLSATFVPGFKFRVIDDSTLFGVYTTVSSEYREITPAEVTAFSPSFNPPEAYAGGYMVTIVTIAEAYTLPITPINLRIEPLLTSQGDIWRGYHAHWLLDTTQSMTIAASPQSWDIARRRSLNATIVPTAVVDGIQYLGESHQELTITVPGVTTILLDSTLQYNPLISTTYATPNSGNVRVYLNGIRQYVNYSEVTAVSPGVPNFTVVGFTSYSTMTIPYVTGIQFDNPLSINDVVLIEVGPAAFADRGLIAVPVRTVEDEAAFTSAVALGTQPVYQPLTQYRQVEQVKTLTNQYPLFDVYNVITGNIVDASSVFSFSEDSSYPINVALTRRIVVSADGKEYQFTQSLLDSDDHLLYGYRDTTGLVDNANPIPQQWWYNPITDIIQGWDGKAWTSHIELFSLAGTMIVRVPTSTPPVTPYELDLWYDDTVNILYEWDIGSLAWIPYNAEVYVGADPTLQTIWKHGLNNEQFVPQYVDGNRNPITVGSTSGDWQLPDQWVYNPEHNNKSTILLSQIYTHVNDILSGQHSSPGLQHGGVFALTQNQINYGVPGTILEHNDSFDTLISAFNVSTTNPLGIIDYAKTEYAGNLVFIQDLYNKSIVSLLSQYSQNSIANLQAYLANSVIIAYEQDQSTTEIYGDTSAYNPVTKKGVEHWIATSPMFGFSAKYVPHVNADINFTEVYHHDGHRSRVVVTSAQADSFARALISQPDSRGQLGKLGIKSSSPPPSTASAFSTAYGTLSPVTGILPGVFWYKVGVGAPILYRLEAYAISNIAPPFYLNGAEIPDGTMYYNYIAEATYKKVGLTWVLASALGSTDISPMWQVVNFQELLAGIYLELETRLYEVTPDYLSDQFEYQVAGVTVQTSTPLDAVLNTYWYNPITATLQIWNGIIWTAPLTIPSTPLALAAPYALQAAEESTYNLYEFDRFMTFAIERNIKAPLVNTTYALAEPFTWNYLQSVITTPPHAGTPPAPASSWQEVYTRWYGTPYPHLEPWALQGFTDKPTWWDANYKDTTGLRRWTVAMWADILAGLTPHGTPPTPAVAYNYVSVNIGVTTTVDGYAPDALFPPFYALGSGTISSLYTIYGQIIAPAADYAFGDVGPTEWMWRTSIEHIYDKLVVDFRMQPVRFMHYAFGPQYELVHGLQVETTFENVYAHQNALFHGDLYNTNEVYTARGLNQWYVNYNRFTGFDTNDTFRQQWSKWTPQITYQVGGIVDTGTFTVSNSYFDICDQDFNIALINNGTVTDVWVDAFNVSLLSMPSALVQYNNQADWKLELTTFADITRSLSCYSVKLYSCLPTVASSTFHALRYGIVSTSSFFRQVIVVGDQTDRLNTGASILLTSLANNGTFTVQGAVYQSNTNTTRLSVLEPIFDGAAEGFLDLLNVSVSWNTGDRVVIETTKLMPSPLVANTAYFVIKTGNNAFQLAETPEDAYANLPVILESPGTGQLSIAEVTSTFVALGGTGNSQDVWYHYALDTSDIITITPPYSFMAMQRLINIIDGYSAYQQSQGLLYGVGAGADFDPDTGRLVDWQLETERFINWAYGLRNARINVADQYGATVTISSTNAMFSGMIPQWAAGTAIIANTTGILPAPLLPKTPYFYQPTAIPGVFQLSVTKYVVSPADLITFTTGGMGSLSLSLVNTSNAFPSFEINPTRTNIWLDTPQGVLANIIEGPYSDIRVQQTIFDQYSRLLQASELIVYREDKQSRIVIRPAIPNDVNTMYVNDPYNYIHLAGGHLFVEGYEHFIIFNDTTVSGNLLYNPFLGLSTKRLTVNYYEKKDYSLRPTLGGFFLVDSEFKRNMEGSATDLHNLYNLQTMSESAATTIHARALLGYTGTSEFMDLININSKSQFLFYRGMIRAKGSLNCVTAYINSRRFVDAQVDECWAWKVADFGDLRPQIYPEIKLFATDGLLDDIRLEFLALSDLPSDPEIVADVANGFQLVSFSDDTRWNNFPEQKSDIISPLFLDAEVTSMAIIYSGVTMPTAQQVKDGGLQYWFDGTNTYEWTGITWSAPITGKLSTSGGFVYFKHDTICDTTRVYRQTLSLIVPTDFTDVTTKAFIEGVGVDQYKRVNSEVVRILQTSFTDIMVIFAVNASQRSISPAQLVDTESHVVLQTTPLWHPAVGFHSPTALYNVDLQTNADPARYLVSLSTPSTNVWNITNVGTRWLDTNLLGYLPYYDDKIYPDVNDRLFNWGKLAPWSSVNVYQWIESTTPPSGWAAKVVSDAKNSAILQNDKATGVARQTIFYRTRSGYPAPWDAWQRDSVIREEQNAVIDIAMGVYTSIPLLDPQWRTGDLAYVYKNGILVASAVPVSGSAVTVPSTAIVELDTLVIVRFIHTITPTEAAFNPDVPSSINIQWSADYEYTTTVVTTGNATSGFVPITYYYFWIEGSTNSDLQDQSGLSALATAQQLEAIPTPYFVVQKPEDDPTLLEKFGYGLIEYGSTFSSGTTAAQFYIVPILYRQAILRNMASYITVDKRFMIRFIRDLTLRDNIQANGNQMNLKDTHQEWFIFRQYQSDAVPTTLWDKLVESLIGYTLADSTIRVPSLDRVLYDMTYGTETQYGLESGQSFVDQTIGLNGVVTYLQDPNNNFAPIDMDSFFTRNNFDTPAAIQKSMTEIYDTFPTIHVNSIWFNALLDAMTTKSKYKDLMKTSWVVLHGIQILGVGGQFDD